MLTPTEFTVPLKLIEQAASQIIDIDFKLTINQPSGDFFYDPWIIKEEFKNTIWEELLSVLPNGIGEARLIKLAPHETYTAHADMDDRYHLNIKSNLSYLVDLTQNDMFLLKPDGIWYNMNAGVVHSAANFGNTDRVQLVVRQLLLKNKLEDPVTISIVSKQPSGYRFLFDNTVSPWLNSANKKSIVSNFSFKDEVISMQIERSELPSLIEILPDIFKVI